MSNGKRVFKPTKTYQPTNGPKAYRGWDEYLKDDRFLGIFKRKFETTFRGQQQQNYEFEILEANFQAPIEKGGDPVDLVGHILVVNHMGQFVSKMEGKKDGIPVVLGQYVDFTYGGKVPDKDDPKQLYHQIGNWDSGNIVEGEEVTPAKASKNDL